MREEFNGLYFSHTVGLATARYGKGDSIKEKLEHLFNLPRTTELSVAREDDRKCLGEYGVVLQGDILEAYDIDCLSKLDENGHRFSNRNKQCTIDEWLSAYTYPEGFIKNWKICYVFYTEQHRGDTVKQEVVELCKRYNIPLIGTPYRKDKQDYIIYR